MILLQVLNLGHLMQWLLVLIPASGTAAVAIGIFVGRESRQNIRDIKSEVNEIRKDHLDHLRGHAPPVVTTVGG